MDVNWMLGLCSCTGCDSHVGQGQGDAQIQLNSTPNGLRHPNKHALTKGDSFDITFTPRSIAGVGLVSSSRAAPITPRQRDLRDQLELPFLHTYPVPPTCSDYDDAETHRQKLLEMYQEFALDMHTGMYLTQLTSNRDYADIHCQLMEDLVTLKLDQSNGRIIEFPLTNVSKVYRILKSDDKWYTAGTPLPPQTLCKAEQIVVVEFMRRKLAFVFKELDDSQRFLICMELLIRRAQEKQQAKPGQQGSPATPQAVLQSKQCSTPRQSRHPGLLANSMPSDTVSTEATSPKCASPYA